MQTHMNIHKWYNNNQIKYKIKTRLQHFVDTNIGTVGLKMV